jgi:RimJ/RimL family protein N-acetyltransferase
MRAVPAGDKLAMICQYMYEKIGVGFDPRQCNGFAILSDDNTFIGAVLVSNVRYSGVSAIDCEISCASENSMAWRPEVCRAVFGYVFGQLGCVRCTSITRKNNTKARAFLEALNFVLEGNIRQGYDGEKDALVYGLLSSECRFFGGLNG